MTFTKRSFDRRYPSNLNRLWEVFVQLRMDCKPMSRKTELNSPTRMTANDSAIN